MINNSHSFRRRLANRCAVTISVAAFFIFSAAVVILAPTALSQSPSSEMNRIFDEDQKDREIDMATMNPKQRADWSQKVVGRDKERRNRVRELISRDELKTAQHYEEAAFVFQHGTEADDFLFAHTLAMVAVAKGSSKSRWIAAATLDRFLDNIHRPQIFGTQYTIGSKPTDKWTQEPYDRTLVPDSLLAAMCVPDRASQQETVETMNQHKESPEPKKHLPGCG